MYAVIKTGGKQYRVEEGQRLDVERVAATTTRSTSTPCSSSTATPCWPRPPQLSGATVAGPGRRRGQGPEDQRLHLQEQVEPAHAAGATASTYATIEITGITKG